MLLKNLRQCLKISAGVMRRGGQGFPVDKAFLCAGTGKEVDVLRVITGSARGRRLRELEGQDTRPTTDRVKEGLFSAIQFDIHDRRVLDLFAGTGQLGIECLSRGAASAVFVDRSPKAAALVRDNLRATDLQERATVTQADALDFLSRAPGRFDLIFLDPPYASNLLEEAIKRIAAFDILHPRGIMIAEYPCAKPFPPLPPPLRTGRTYRYGKISVTLCRRDSPCPDNP